MNLHGRPTLVGYPGPNRHRRANPLLLFLIVMLLAGPGSALQDGGVDGSDLGVWNSSKFTSVAAWCSGDFHAAVNRRGRNDVL